MRTIKEVYDALAKNGYEWGQHEFVNKYPDGTIASACAIGQAALNLNVEPLRLHEVLNYPNGLDGDDPYVGLAGAIEDYNDNEASSWDDLVIRAKEILEPYFDMEIDI